MSAKSYKDHLYALVMAGGGGTRLWPRSRDKTPKQFLKLFGNKTLLEITIERLRKFLPWERIFISTATIKYEIEIKRLLPSVPKNHIIVEPARRDTAPAHGLGALPIYKKDYQAVIINAASDHFIRPEKNYKKIMYAASCVAYEGNFLVAVGVRPSYPHTGMGHIRRGKKIKTVEGKIVYKLDKFVEKPPLPQAKRYTSSGNYFWNANQYVWKADSFLQALSNYQPEIYKNLMMIGKFIGTKKEKQVLEKYYNLMPKISVDYAVSEKAKNFLMLVADYEWTDIGDWNEVWKNLTKDEYGNVVIDGDAPGGEVINLDTSDALIHTDGRLIAIIDVDNIIVVDTDDALLICSKSKAQNVKKIVEQLKQKSEKE